MIRFARPTSVPAPSIHANHAAKRRADVPPDSPPRTGAPVEYVGQRQAVR